jgi:hypothetical protein
LSINSYLINLSISYFFIIIILFLCSLPGKIESKIEVEYQF